MSDSLVQMKTELLSERDELEFELFAVGQGVAPERQEALQLRSNSVTAKLQTIDHMLQSKARALVVTVPPVSSMSKRQINAEFAALMIQLDT